MFFKSKLRVHLYFTIINAFIAMLIACRYFVYLSEFPTDILGFSFLISSVISHMALLMICLGIVLIPFLLLPNIARRLTQSAAFSLALIVLFIDTIVFAQYRFHISIIMLELVMSGQVVSFGFMTWFMTIAGIVIVWAAQYFLLVYLEKKTETLTAWKFGKKFTALFFICFIISHGIHIWAVANVYQPVTVTKKYLPLFYPTTANGTMEKYGWIDEKALEKQKAMSLSNKSDLNYPRQALQVEPIEKPLNIVLIAVDSWRADTFNADNTPNVWGFAQSGKIFNNHISAGNATRTGIFGLFYGIPGTYWHAMLANHRSPVFIDRLQELNYDLGLFASAKLTNPEFHQTVFANVKNLRVGSQGPSPSDADKNLTKDWIEWFDHRDQSKPYFSFLFYDAPHGYDFPKDYPHRYEPMLNEVNYLKLNNDTDRSLMMNRYKTSVHFVDSQIKIILDKLKQSGDLENTVIIITGDHGQEVNDNKDNYWGHNSNYTDPQVKVPFVIIGPKVKESQIMQWDSNAYTSHQDVIPTLMKNYLGVNNDVHDYSVGEDLFGPPIARDWILASNYSSYAIISPESILEVGVVGQYSILDKHNRPIKGQQPNAKNLQAALEQISRFNR
ncbi:choline-sulfatase [Acinetobacter sp. ANC 4558]|uniref:DUF3413 domain-containing protein n=1 Tax=Acinetobacter sp. ANC 4558 TaxID=1977876 RepID=UPI000A32F38B|nr:DUF3413 domain-containing protein [Acinetobacter sp. ANC 4558]OTG83240.1 choline-sulfatase [Acinetobacter sp. ANC 4558]